MTNLRSAILDILYKHRTEWLNATAVRELLKGDAGEQVVTACLCSIARDGAAETEMVSGVTVFRFKEV